MPAIDLSILHYIRPKHTEDNELNNGIVLHRLANGVCGFSSFVLRDLPNEQCSLVETHRGVARNSQRRARMKLLATGRRLMLHQQSTMNCLSTTQIALVTDSFVGGRFA